MTLRSPSRNASSPKRSKMSEMEQPAAVSISLSASRKAQPSFAASLRPTELLPAPIIPTSATVRFKRLIVSSLTRPKARLPSGTCANTSNSATKVLQILRMGAMESVNEMGWTARITLGFLVLLIVGAGALAIYASSLKPPHRTYEQVIPNDHFPS
jgi:hypothetical protein